MWPIARIVRTHQIAAQMKQVDNRDQMYLTAVSIAAVLSREGSGQYKDASERMMRAYYG